MNLPASQRIPSIFADLAPEGLRPCAKNSLPFMWRGKVTTHSHVQTQTIDAQQAAIHREWNLRIASWRLPKWFKSLRVGLWRLPSSETWRSWQRVNVTQTSSDVRKWQPGDNQLRLIKPGDGTAVSSWTVSASSTQDDCRDKRCLRSMWMNLFASIRGLMRL